MSVSRQLVTSRSNPSTAPLQPSRGRAQRRTYALRVSWRAKELGARRHFNQSANISRQHGGPYGARSLSLRPFVCFEDATWDETKRALFGSEPSKHPIAPAVTHNNSM